MFNMVILSENCKLKLNTTRLLLELQYSKILLLNAGGQVEQQKLVCYCEDVKWYRQLWNENTTRGIKD